MTGWAHCQRQVAFLVCLHLIVTLISVELWAEFWKGNEFRSKTLKTISGNKGLIGASAKNGP